MKTYQDRQQQIRRERVGAMINGRMAALFRRLPMLAGFAIDAYLQPTEVSVCTWPGYVAGEDLFGEILGNACRAGLADGGGDRRGDPGYRHVCNAAQGLT